MVDITTISMLLSFECVVFYSPGNILSVPGKALPHISIELGLALQLANTEQHSVIKAVQQWNVGFQ